ncbi:MAG TPA: restriction endonuclease, partial [Rubrobacteraceae bacterium]
AQFEVFTADLFRAMGDQAVVLGGAGDQGVDVIVNRRGERVAVQCKNHRRPVGNRPVQEVYAGARHHRCVEACVVAPAGYTRGAIALARSTGVSLYDADTVRQWIRKVDKLEKERASESEIRNQNTPITKEMADARKRAVWHPHPDDPPKS